MIWTEDENMDREMGTMINPKGKSCINCQWGEGLLKQKDRDNGWTTCGHHHQNFKVNSLCADWTDPNDPKLVAHFNKRKKELKKRLPPGPARNPPGDPNDNPVSWLIPPIKNVNHEK